ncbi:MAG: ornithine carbamoyltransferase [SAR202 cluster bacterium Casp-Chloro-G4]|nr:ornithine carbamoyltransferase [Chloroflexota bacterium]PKB61934.1 MAG: ornithine carbamoyltransferase [SAR202 cluster bacterium Casp-Chloro-G4]
MKGKDFLSVADLSSEEVLQMVQKAMAMKAEVSARPLEGKQFALLFEKPSLRTRVSFEVGIRQMGGQCVYLSKDDVGLGTREPEEDIARVLDRWVDGIIARVYSHRSLEILSKHTSIPVLNALSDMEHPCQAMADMLTIQEHKGSFDGLRVAFIGDGNNVACSLSLACASVGADFVLASPKDYQMPSPVLEEAKRRAAVNESSVDWVETPAEAVEGADVVYTDTWVSMGHEAEKAERLPIFKDYKVDESLVKGAKSDFVFMHDMPAYRGQEVSDGMIDHPRSVVFDQAENRLHAQKAILAELFSNISNISK